MSNKMIVKTALDGVDFYAFAPKSLLIELHNHDLLPLNTSIIVPINNEKKIDYVFIFDNDHDYSDNIDSFNDYINDNGIDFDDDNFVLIQVSDNIRAKKTSTFEYLDKDVRDTFKFSLDTLIVSGDKWRSYICEDENCCPQDGDYFINEPDTETDDVADDNSDSTDNNDSDSEKLEDILSPELANFKNECRFIFDTVCYPDNDEDIDEIFTFMSNVHNRDGLIKHLISVDEFDREKFVNSVFEWQIKYEEYRGAGLSHLFATAGAAAFSIGNDDDAKDLLKKSMEISQNNLAGLISRAINAGIPGVVFIAATDATTWQEIFANKQKVNNNG